MAAHANREESRGIVDVVRDSAEQTGQRDLTLREAAAAWGTLASGHIAVCLLAPRDQCVNRGLGITTDACRTDLRSLIRFALCLRSLCSLCVAP
ncbi:hypothetical protein HPB50_015433 [Hyalomma asiaticum]|uniref:Uncharacterized protein n=1 Tax=Hyalomma asiaticum TaxID=266040 RepID=A0ACB7TL18_HYAAI|nr:hypothetical protein HPB50_015433 [Hyalomma asiaticum]